MALNTEYWTIYRFHRENITFALYKRHKAKAKWMWTTWKIWNFNSLSCSDVWRWLLLFFLIWCCQWKWLVVVSDEKKYSATSFSIKSQQLEWRNWLAYMWTHINASNFNNTHVCCAFCFSRVLYMSIYMASVKC